MKKRVVYFVNVCIGACLLVCGIWQIYAGVCALINFFGEQANGEFVRSVYSTFLWGVMLLDYSLCILFGILRIYPFIRRKSGKYICSIACINLISVFLLDVCYHKELGFTMVQLNPRRLIIPVILLLTGGWWQHYYRKNEEQISNLFPYIGELKKLANN